MPILVKSSIFSSLATRVWVMSSVLVLCGRSTAFVLRLPTTAIGMSSRRAAAVSFATCPRYIIRQEQRQYSNFLSISYRQRQLASLRISTRLFSTNGSNSDVDNANTTIPVEVSPANHGTTPWKTFRDHNDKNTADKTSKIDRRILRAMEKDGLTTPTPIQAHAMPLLMRGDDVMASAVTGSGKTLMFALPLAHRLLMQQLYQQPRRDGVTSSPSTNPKKTVFPQGIILSPTRELAQQTAAVLERLAATPTRGALQVCLATGGSDTKLQRRALATAAAADDSSVILVGTPGRILQFVDERSLRLDDCREIVVDEADRMLDLGFEPQLRRIARALGNNNNRRSSSPRHTILCSATFPAEVQRLASEFLRGSYYFVAAGRVGATHENIAQTLQWVDGGAVQRRWAAVDIVREHCQTHDKSNRVVVFTNTKDDAEKLTSALKEQGRGGVRVVHGDKAQTERNKSLAEFRDGKVQTLVATDVAARGLDVPEVGLVVQVDAPRNVDSYVHRIGRTGRAGNKGRAVALLDGRSVSLAPDLVKLLQEANQPVPAWLAGMSHVATVRRLEEESAIAAGGGGLSGRWQDPSGSVSMDPPANNVDHENSFSGQDFRSSAAAGSWGSERDTSYRTFDEEAYKSLDELCTSTEGGTNINSDSALESTKDSNSMSETDAVNSFEDSPFEKLVKQIDSETPVERAKPSKELSQKLKQLSGSDQVDDTPDKKTLSALSRRDANQQLRFEYLGLFPFQSVADLLRSKESKDSKDGENGRLPRVLMVAEKPSIAKAIAEALSGQRGPRERRGISRALPVYEFTTPSFDPFPSKNKPSTSFPARVTVTSVVGHIFGLGFDEDRARGSRRDPHEYFRMPVVKQEESTTGKLRVVDHLVALAADTDYLVLWLDLDAEGENIAHEVIGVVRRSLEQNVNNRGDTDPEQPTRRIARARFSSITGEALRDAFARLEEPDPALSRSVDARQELDLRVGVAMTRLLTWKCVGLARDKFSSSTRLVSYGPCQTPALSLCVDRAREIRDFKPKEYWKVDIMGRPTSGEKRVIPLRWKVPTDDAVEDRDRSRSRKGNDKTVVYEKNASFDASAARNLINMASTSGATATIVRVENTSESMNAPLGLNTVALLSAGSKAMGLSPKQVMSVAEKLYSAGFISYPRTETTKYDPNGFDVRAMLKQHSSHPEWGKTAAHLLRTKYSNSGRPPLRGYDAGDHPPITTVKPATRDEVGGGSAWRVYEFISRNFLGSLSDDFVYTRNVAHLEIGGGSGRPDAYNLDFEQIEVKELGFAGACPWILKDVGASRKGETLELKEGGQLRIEKASVQKDSTRPPRFLQEHELIELMDRNRIGTDASMATHVNNIVDRDYVVLCDETGEPLRPPRPPVPGRPRPPRQIGRYLVPTPLGLSLIDLFGKINNHQDKSIDSLTEGQSPALLARPSIRAQMEQEVRQIALGELDKDEVLEKNLKWFEERYLQLQSELQSRLGKFRSSLKPTRASLKEWKAYRVFEPPSNTQAPQSRTQPAKTNGRYNNSKNKVRGQKSGKASGLRNGKGYKGQSRAKRSRVGASGQ